MFSSSRILVLKLFARVPLINIWYGDIFLSVLMYWLKALCLLSPVLIIFHCFYSITIFRSDDNINVSGEMQHCFPTLTGQSRQRVHPYIPRHTYTPPMRPRVQRTRASTPAIVSIAKSFTRDVILLAPSEGCVPRGSTRAALHDQGRVANIVDFMSSWDEDKTRKRIEDCFQSLLDFNKPYPRCV